MSDKTSGCSVTITLSEDEFEKLRACSEYRKLNVDEVVRMYIRDWIETDHPASQGRFGRRQIYRDYPTEMQGG